jgi:ABC-type transporter Mla subunit MlaD
MPLQDLTPQLRTRLNKMERAVGWFVFLATVLLLSGFGYYLYHTAERKGWFKIKAPFFTYVQSSDGLKVGDPVVMMGFQVGQITLIQPTPPRDTHNVKIKFEIVDPYFRYLWTGGSSLKVNATGFLGQRQLEITRGTNGYALCVSQPVTVMGLDEAREIAAAAPGDWQLAQDVTDVRTNVIFFPAYAPVEAVLDASNAPVLAQCLFVSNSIFIYNNQVNRNRIVASWHRRSHRYVNFKPDAEDAYLRAVEAPLIADELQAVVAQVQSALPGILALTNKIATVLDNTANATSNLNTTIVAAQPMVTNFAAISAQLREPGGLGVWALGTHGNGQMQGALTNVNSLLVDTDTNLNQLTAEIGLTLINVANITSNLNVQVQANSNLLSGISKTVTDADDMMQGLKRHWLLRSAFKAGATNAPSAPAKK